MQPGPYFFLPTWRAFSACMHAAGKLPFVCACRQEYEDDAHPKEATTAPWTLMGGASWMYSIGDLVLPET